MKKTLQILALALTTLLFVAGFWVTTPAALAADIEPLHGLQLTDRYCTIFVTSTGCTEKEDFVTILQKSEPPVVTFIRLTPDFCKAVPRVMPIRFTLEEVGATTFTVSNLETPSPQF